MPERPEVIGIIGCDNVDCTMRGCGDALDYLQRGLTAAESETEIKTYTCYGLCQQGPNILLFYHSGNGVMISLDRTKNPDPDPDLDDILEHILRGKNIDELLEKARPFQGQVDLAVEFINTGIIPGFPPKE